MREASRVARGGSAALMFLLLAGCGQTGKLYLPEDSGEVVTRPASTPPAEPGRAPNSPSTVDSPSATDSPAPEVTDTEDAERKKNGTTPPEDPRN